MTSLETVRDRRGSPGAADRLAARRAPDGYIDRAHRQPHVRVPMRSGAQASCSSFSINRCSSVKSGSPTYRLTISPRLLTTNVVGVS
jgi:hypothetical protein